MVKAEELIKQYTEKGYTVATAESCTGGMIAEKLTDVAGSSAVILGGVVSYAVSVKEKVLGVESSVIEKYGVVSKECAAGMAEGAKRVTGATFAVSTTGVAGPSGGTKETPVGTVCFGIASPDKTESETVYFGEEKSRDEIRKLATEHAIQLAIAAADNYNA